MDTLSFARMGAEVTGVDISDASIAQAKSLADELKIPARFIRSNIYDLHERHNEQYDIVYTSYGAINWLDDMDAWAKTISQFLKPGAVFYMVEFHPYSYSLGEDLQIKYPYFNAKAIESNVDASYTDNSEVKKENLKHVEWHHSLSEVLNALISQGLTIELMNEFPYQVYNCFPNMVEMEKGKWVYEKYGDRIPYMYSIRAIKK